MAFNEDNNKVVKATSTNTSLLSDVRLIVEQGLQTAYEGVNSVMVKTYWQVGRRIVEEEQQGENVLNTENKSLHCWLKICRKVIIGDLLLVIFGRIVSSI